MKDYMLQAIISKILLRFPNKGTNSMLYSRLKKSLLWGAT